MHSLKIVIYFFEVVFKKAAYGYLIITSINLNTLIQNDKLNQKNMTSSFLKQLLLKDQLPILES